MDNYKFETLTVDDSRFIDFRKLVSEVEVDDTYRYWFSDEKINKMDFINIDVCLNKEEHIIGVCGCSKMDSETIRVSQLLYVLPDYRKEVRHLLIADGGFFDRQHATAKKYGFKKMFVALHSFNKETGIVAKVYKTRRHQYRWLRKFDYVGQRTVRYVLQHCYEYKINYNE